MLFQFLLTRKSKETERAFDNNSNALSVSFDQKVGHDYLQESKERFEFYKKKEERLELDLDSSTRLQEVVYQVRL